MNGNQARELIKTVLEAPFNEEHFTKFISNLLFNFDTGKGRDWCLGAYVYRSARVHVRKYRRLGLYTDPDGKELEVLLIQVHSLDKLDRARTALRNFVVKYLQDDTNKAVTRDYALAAFFAHDDDGSEWRFSFIKVEHEDYLNDRGKVKTRRELTPAKRYSFLVGANENSYTGQNQLLPLVETDYFVPKLGDVEAAFGIEKVSSEFFQQYKELYLNLFEYLTGSAQNKEIFAAIKLDISRFAKKLLGQIVFLYFLQKKGWLGVKKGEKWGRGDKRFLQSLFDGVAKDGSNFYSDYLRYLFYEALAKERGDKDDPAFYERFDCKIPFLNGGLFEADYDWENLYIHIPNDQFRNMVKTKAGDVGTGILDVFDRYNFTVKEDEPLEKEVAVDPEMLGKVFENMLEVTERKSKGAFYTPREIVHYMCRESLIQYLDNALNSREAICPRDDLELFVRDGYLVLENEKSVLQKGKETADYNFKLPKCIRDHARLLDQKLAKIKICDPAIGSGAFPVGLLNEIVNARLALQPFLVDDVTDEGQMDALPKPYDLKRHAIQENIYGVDIDASAVDIARLRLWLSLIVDEKNYENIEALPNLDYKIVQGNSLIGFPEKYKSENTEKIEKLKAQYFKTTKFLEKHKLKNEIDQKINRFLYDSKSSAGYKINFDFKIFFSEIWHENSGFDIVLGNPPYLRIQGIRKDNPEQADVLARLYKSATGSYDLYILFLEKGLAIAAPKGIVNYIMPLKWTNAAFGKGIRKIIGGNFAKRIISFGAYQVFNASTYTGIQWFQKGIESLSYLELDRDLTNNKILGDYLNSLNDSMFNDIPGTSLSDDAWILADKNTSEILNRIYKHKKTIGDLFKKIFQGIATSKDSVYFLLNCRSNNDCIIGYSKELGKEVKIERGLLKPLLKGDQVHKYEHLNTSNYVIVPYKLDKGRAILFGEKELKKKFPMGYAYLKDNEDALRMREKGRLLADKYWYRYIYPKNLDLFSNPKLFCPDISLGGNFTYDSEGKFYSTTTLYGYIKNESSNVSYECLLAILNSKVCWYFMINTGTVLANNYFRFKPDYIKRFPVPTINEEIGMNVDICVQFVLYLKGILPKSNLHIISYFQDIIDALVFELYFPDEIKATGQEILKHLGELIPLTEIMSDEEKQSIIRNQFDRLYDPSYPLRNHMEGINRLKPIRTIIGI